MKIQAIREKKDHELFKQLREEREALRSFRFGLSGGRSRDIKEGTKRRRTIARILTEIASRSRRAEHAGTR